MREWNMDQVVAAVTQQVLAALHAEAQDASGQEGKDKLLILGDPVHIPDSVTGCAAVYTLADYQNSRNILRYQKVVIERLTFSQLADIAQGRVSDDVCCAVTQALLQGVDVLMLEQALPHRKYAGQGSTRFYQMLEEHAQALQVFGIKLLDGQLRQPVGAPVKPPKYQAPAAAIPRGSACPNAGRLITEEIALRMVESANGSVCIPASAILTPSARDIFAQARFAVTWDD